jgi:hypothetical protein
LQMQLQPSQQLQVSASRANQNQPAKQDTVEFVLPFTFNVMGTFRFSALACSIFWLLCIRVQTTETTQGTRRARVDAGCVRQLLFFRRERSLYQGLGSAHLQLRQVVAGPPRCAPVCLGVFFSKVG